MDIIQEMTDRRLLNVRNKAKEGLFFGVDNWDAVDSFDNELLRRGLIKRTTRQEFNESTI